MHERSNQSLLFFGLSDAPIDSERGRQSNDNISGRSNTVVHEHNNLRGGTRQLRTLRARCR